MKQAIERIEEVAARRASVFGSNGKQVAEQVRGAIAKEYLEQMRDESIIIDKLTGNQVVDGVKMASLIRSRGEAIDRLFAGNKKDLDDLVDVLSLTKANVSPDVLNSYYRKFVNFHIVLKLLLHLFDQLL